MILFRTILVALLLPVWALFTIAAVAMLSVGEGALTDPQLQAIGLGGSRLDKLQSVAIGVAVAGLALHLIAWFITSRSVAAMAGSIGALIGAAIAGLLVLVLAAAPSSERVEVYRLLVHPGAAGALAAIALFVGLRAWLAYTGRWRYRVLDLNDPADWGTE